MRKFGEASAREKLFIGIRIGVKRSESEKLLLVLSSSNGLVMM